MTKAELEEFYAERKAQERAANEVAKGLFMFVAAVIVMAGLESGYIILLGALIYGAWSLIQQWRDTRGVEE